MVLAGMKIKQWKAEGRKEGREEGRTEGRAEGKENQRKRQEEAYAKFGFEVNGVLVLPKTPEVERFLAAEPDPSEQ